MRERPHLSRALLDACFEGRASSYDLIAEVARLLEGECEGCETRLAGARADYQRSLREASRRMRAELAELEEERRALPMLLRELSSHRPPEDLLRVAADRRFHTAAFVAFELSAAWSAVETEIWGSAQDAVGLASAATARLDADRHGRIVIARVRGEVQLARARVATALGRDRELGQALDATEAWIPASLSDELHAGLLLARAVQASRGGETDVARRHLEQAELLCRGGQAERWRPSIATMLATLERRAGRPDLAAERLRRLLASRGGRPQDPSGWRAAHELIAALVAAGEAEEAAAHVAAWRGEPDISSEPEGRLDPAAAELAHLRGVALHALGSRERATAALRWALGAHATLGRGLRAVAAAADLAKMNLQAPEQDSTEWLARRLEELVARHDLPGEALAALTRFSGALWRGTLSREDVDDLEDDLFHLDPPWGPADHEPP